VIGGVELGGTKCILAVAKSPTEIIKRKIISTERPDFTLPEIFRFFNNFEIESIGVGTFGPINLDTQSKEYGLLISESKKNWKGTNIFSEFSNNINAKISIDTDVNAAAIGEYFHGSGKNCDNLVYVTIGTGIGVGVLVNGKSYTGNYHLEAGHIPVPNPDQVPGVCRIHGECWEGLASGTALERRWKMQGSKIPETHIAWEKESQLIAYGLVSIVANHSPDKIILGGGVMEQSHLYSKITLHFKKMWNDYTPILTDLISKPGLGSDSGIVGSLILADGEPAQI
jgi:fructokinase